MKKHPIKIIASALAIIGVIATIMAFFGIPGVIPLVTSLFRPDLEDIRFCDAKGGKECPDILITEKPDRSLIIANRIDFTKSVQLQPNTVILANEINLGGHQIFGEAGLVIFSRVVENGRITVKRKDRAEGATNSQNVRHGASGGDLYAVIGKIPNSVVFDVSGDDGKAGSNGEPGKDGRNADCINPREKCINAEDFDVMECINEFFKEVEELESPKRGGKGQKGGDGGDGGDGGLIQIRFATGAISQQNALISGGEGGDGGQGGPGGRGGYGCQLAMPDAPIGPDGVDGSHGDNGKRGASELTELYLKDMVKFSRRTRNKPKNELYYEIAQQKVAALQMPKK